MINEDFKPQDISRDGEEILILASSPPTDSIDAAMDRWKCALEQRKSETDPPTNALVAELFEAVRKVFPQIVAYDLINPPDSFVFEWKWNNGTWERRK